MTMPTIDPRDPAVQHVAKALARHEDIGGGHFCSCSPKDTDPDAFPESHVPLAVYWDTHVAQVAVEAHIEYLRSLP